MKEIICIHVGQAGVQIGNACWELFVQEHGLSVDGLLPTDYQGDRSALQPIFYETPTQKYVPRAIQVDLQPDPIDQILVSPTKTLFDSKNMITSKQGSSSIFSLAYCIRGTKIIDQVLDRTRLLAEKCDNLQGFMIFHGTAGGTGSGLCNLVLERLGDKYPLKNKIGFTVTPSPNISNSVVQPYNTVLFTNGLLQHLDLTILYDNQSLNRISSHQLQVDCPTYLNANRLIAQTASSLTASTRFRGPLNCNFQDLITNLVPYPRLHIVSPSYSPFLSSERAFLEKPTVEQMTFSVFDPENQMVSCNPHHGQYMACALSYRGDVIPSEVHSSLQKIKQKNTVEFVDWVPTGLKVGINSNSPTTIPGDYLAQTRQSCCMLSNTTAIAQIYSGYDHKFDLMYAKRAFVHWYAGTVFEDVSFEQNRQNLAALEKDYEEAGLPTQQHNSIDEDEWRLIISFHLLLQVNDYYTYKIYQFHLNHRELQSSIWKITLSLSYCPHKIGRTAQPCQQYL